MISSGWVIRHDIRFAVPEDIPEIRAVYNIKRFLDCSSYGLKNSSIE